MGTTTCCHPSSRRPPMPSPSSHCPPLSMTRLHRLPTSRPSLATPSSSRRPLHNISLSQVLSLFPLQVSPQLVQLNLVSVVSTNHIENKIIQNSQGRWRNMEDGCGSGRPRSCPGWT